MSTQYQIIVVGSGSAGKDAALLAARSGFSTLLVEAADMGGTCLHRGVHAVRALRACATHRDDLRERSSRMGTSVDLVESGWSDWLNVQRRTSGRLTEGLGRALDRAKVNVKFGWARFLSPNQLVIDDPQGGHDTVGAEHVIVATGSRPAYSGVEKFRVLNSDQFLRHATVPGHLFVIGGGYVGCELAAIHRTLGARVTLAEARPRLLSGWDEEIGQHMHRTLENVGVEVLLNNPVTLPTELSAPPRFQLGNATVVTPDLTLVATGRVPNVEGLGLEALDLASTGFIPVNEHLQTRVKSVYAIGDVNGMSLLDSVASAQARVAVETIRGMPARFDLHWIPRCLHAEPPIASAGWTEAEANAAGQDVEVLAETLQLITDDDATVIEPEPTRLKVVVQMGTARILGCVAIGHHAVELVNLTSTAIRYGLTARQLADLSPVHPSASEALVRLLQERFDRLQYA